MIPVSRSVLRYMDVRIADEDLTAYIHALFKANKPEAWSSQIGRLSQTVAQPHTMQNSGLKLSAKSLIEEIIRIHEWRKAQ